MSELNELKNLVIQSLESNGVLSNIRAQIRASVFKIIDSSDKNQKNEKENAHDWENQKCSKMKNEAEGKLLLALIKEFFQFFNMEYSQSVFQSESNFKSDLQRDQLAEQIGLQQQDKNLPLLYQLLRSYLSQHPNLNVNLSSQSNSKMDVKEQSSEIKKIEKYSELEKSGDRIENVSSQQQNDIYNFAQNEDQLSNGQNQDKSSENKSQQSIKMQDQKEKKSENETKNIDQQVRMGLKESLKEQGNENQSNKNENRYQNNGKNDSNKIKIEDEKNIQEDLNEGNVQVEEDIKSLDPEDLVNKGGNSSLKGSKLMVQSGQFNSSGEMLANSQSQSQGLDMSVTSAQLDDYDYSEQVEEV